VEALTPQEIKELEQAVINMPDESITEPETSWSPADYKEDSGNDTMREIQLIEE
jgi:hypothetical protein